MPGDDLPSSIPCLLAKEPEHPLVALDRVLANDVLRSTGIDPALLQEPDDQRVFTDCFSLGFLGRFLWFWRFLATLPALACCARGFAQRLFPDPSLQRRTHIAHLPAAGFTAEHGMPKILYCFLVTGCLGLLDCRLLGLVKEGALVLAFLLEGNHRRLFLRTHRLPNDSARLLLFRRGNVLEVAVLVEDIAEHDSFKVRPVHHPLIALARNSQMG